MVRHEHPLVVPVHGAYIIAMERVRKASKISLKSLQSVNGIINHLIQHCPAIKFFRAPIIDDIKRADKAKKPITPSPATIDTLGYWQNMLHDLCHGFPIPDRDFKPDGDIQFVTDMAGPSVNPFPELFPSVRLCHQPHP